MYNKDFDDSEEFDGQDETEFDLLGQTDTIQHDIDFDSEDDGAIAKADLYKIAKYAYKLFQKIQDADQLEDWIQIKITKASDFITSVYHYLEYEKEFSDFGKHLEDSDIYTESEKRALRGKLMEARKAVSKLKIAQAEKVEKDLEKATKPKTKKPTAKKVEEAAKTKPSAGMTKKQKSAVVKKAKAGEDIGKPGKGFKKVVAAAKKGGAKDPTAVAAAAMWKQAKKKAVKEGIERDSFENLSFETTIADPESGRDIDVKVEYEVIGQESPARQSRSGEWEPPQNSQVEIISVTDQDTGEEINLTPELEDELVDQVNNLDGEKDDFGDYAADEMNDQVRDDSLTEPDSFEIKGSEDSTLRESTNLDHMLKLAGLKQLNG